MRCFERTGRRGRVAYLVVMGLTGFVLAARPVGAQDDSDGLAGTVVTTTTYEYDSLSLLPTVVEVSSDGAYRKTEMVYAHRAYSGMRNANMLSQVFRTITREENGQPVACSETTWRTWNGGAFWAPQESLSGCGIQKVRAAIVFEYDDNGRVRYVRDAAGLNTFYEYDGSGRIIAVSEADAADNGQPAGVVLTTSYAYDNRGRVSSVTDPNGAETGYTYDGLGRLTRVSNDEGRVTTRYEYVLSAEATGTYRPHRPNRVTTIFPASDNRATTAWFDGLGRPIGTTAYASGTGQDRSSYDDVTLTEYDAAGRPWRDWRPIRAQQKQGGAPVPRTPTANPGTAEHWDGGLFVQPSAFPSRSEGYWKTQRGVDPADADEAYTETEYERSPLGRPLVTRAPGGAETTYAYGVGRPSVPQGRRPEGTPERMSYVETTDADGRVVRTFTDALGRERFVEVGIGTPERALTEMIYDAADRLVETRPPTCFRPRGDDTTSCADHATTYRYDTRGNLTETVSPDAGRTLALSGHNARDAVRQTPTQRGQGEATFVSYDKWGRPLTETIRQTACGVNQIDPATFRCPGGERPWTGLKTNVRRYQYDTADGVFVGDPGPFEVDPSFAFAYGRGRLVAEAAWSGGKVHSTAYRYDAEGRDVGRFARTHGVASEVAVFEYDYDRGGQLTERRVEVGTHVHRQQYAYTSDGLPYRVYTGTGTGGDASGIGAGSEAVYTYNAAGALTSTVFDRLALASKTPLKQEDRWYDIQGRIVAVQNPAWGQSPFREELAYTTAGQIARVVTQWPVSGPYAGEGAPAGTPQAWRSWSYDLAYDGVGRLRTALYGDGTGPAAGAFDLSNLAYDGNGNIEGLLRYAPTPTGGSKRVDNLSYSYEPGTNQLKAVGDAADGAYWYGTPWDADPSTFVHRADGALVRLDAHPQGGWGPQDPTAFWVGLALDDRGQPTHGRVRTVDETRPPENPAYVVSDAYARYDGAGWRVTREVVTDGVWDRTWTVRDGAAVVGEFDGSTGALRYWNTATGRYQATGTGPSDGSGRWHVYRRDHLGTVRAVQRGWGPAEVRGEVVEARDYYPFGLQMPGRTYVSGTVTREDFTGHELDVESGLHYMGARYYMAALGRFTSVDPHAASYPGWSPYSYAFNDPLGFTDPTGKDPCDLDGDGENESNCLVDEQGNLVDGRQASVEVVARRPRQPVSLAVLAPLAIPAAAEPTPLGEIGLGLAATGILVYNVFMADGYAPDMPLPQTEDGVRIPDCQAPHTQLGTKDSRRGGRYRQTREWGEGGRLIRDGDWTDHGRPDIPGHTNPHAHDWLPNPTGGTLQRGPARPFPNMPLSPSVRPLTPPASGC